MPGVKFRTFNISPYQNHCFFSVTIGAAIDKNKKYIPVKFTKIESDSVNQYRYTHGNITCAIPIGDKHIGHISISKKKMSPPLIANLLFRATLHFIRMETPEQTMYLASPGKQEEHVAEVYNKMLNSFYVKLHGKPEKLLLLTEKKANWLKGKALSDKVKKHRRENPHPYPILGKDNLIK